MIYYLDTSALVKRYYAELGSLLVQNLFVQANLIVSSKIAYAELLSALARKRRVGEITERAFLRATNSFQHEWQECVVVEVTNAVFAGLLPLVQRQALRGFDAIHLCSALWFRQQTKTDIIFVCADQRLAGAAEDEGLEVINPESIE